MVKKFTTLVMALLFSIAVYAQEWIGFGSKGEGTPPEVSISRNDNQQVKFTVSLSGMYVEQRQEESGVYKRLSMPECQTVGEVGSPEIPKLIKMVAIPECSSFSLSVTMSGHQTFTGYNVYPVPEQEPRGNEDGTVYLAEVFAKNDEAYAQNKPIPAQDYMVIDTGYMRAQRYLRLELYPARYNAVTQTLSIATDMEITMQFANATTDVNVPLGIFNNVGVRAFVNFVDQGITAAINDKAFEKEGFERGQVKYKKVTKPQDVHGLTVDYLIICADVFYPSGTQPHPEVMRLANHRADYNGYNVLILNANDIVKANFSYEGIPSNPNDTTYKKEQRIRSCIREIYNTCNAPNTYDGKLGFVLLVGNADGGHLVNSGMPTSYDHYKLTYGPGNHPDYAQYNIFSSDYYYSCVTGNYYGNNPKEPIADLYLGRFCVPNNLSMDSLGGLKRLQNMVTKTIKYETEFKDPLFKKRLNIALGGGEGLHSSYYLPWVNYVQPHLQDPSKLSGVNTFDYGDGQNSLLFGQKVRAMLNDEDRIGGIFSMQCHGGVKHWWGGDDGILCADTLSKYLQNPHRQPFCMSTSCLTGRFDDPKYDSTVYPYCLAEYMTSYSDSMGFVSMLAASTLSIITSDPKKGHYSNLPVAVHRDLSFIVGEFILETTAAVEYECCLMYNLFGDPALNIMAEGFEINNTMTLVAPVTNISCKVTIKSNGNLIIPAGKTVFLDTKGSITIEGIGKITMENNSKITSFPEHSPARFIKCNKGLMSVASNATATMENLHFITTESSNDINFNNVIYSDGAYSYNIKKCNFTNSRLNLGGCVTQNTNINESTFTDSEIYFMGSTSGTPSEFKLNNSHFVRSSIFHINYKFSIKNNCTFTNSTLTVTNSKSSSIQNSVFTDSQIFLFDNAEANPVATTFTNSQFVRSPITHSDHKLVATGCKFNDRSDIITTYSITDIQNCRFHTSGFLARTQGLVSPMPYTPFVKINNSSFRNTGTFNVYYEGSPPVAHTASISLYEIPEFEIVGDTIINTNAGKGNDPGGGLQNAPYGEGISLNDAGKGTANKNLISGNEISWCETGLKFYNSKAQVLGNEIYNNTYGARLFNNSQSTFMGSDGVGAYTYGYQIIRDNTSYDVYATNNAFPSSFKYNQILKSKNPNHIPRIYYDVTSPGSGGFGTSPYNISCNYWSGNFIHDFDIFPPLKFISAPVWDLINICTSKGKGLYDDGMEYFENENYPAAKSAFLELIETEPDDPFSIAALHELFSLEQFIDNDYAALHNYYTTFTPADSALFDVADFLATRCNVVIQNWQPAIDWYEDRIENPPSYQDSVFAVIDLGDIHLKMENDSLKACRIFRFPNIKPKSRQQYEENKSALLATLPKKDQPRPQHPLAGTGKKGVLSQNIPNPAKESTTIVYDVIEEGSVHLRIYNQLGQLLQDLPQGTQKPGSYHLEVSLVGMPAGVYHYVLFVEGEKADGKKLVVN